MKATEYKVIYLNGDEKYFYTFSFTYAIVLAMADNISLGKDIRIKYISDEDGNTIKDIQPPTYQF